MGAARLGRDADGTRRPMIASTPRALSDALSPSHLKAKLDYPGEAAPTSTISIGTCGTWTLRAGAERELDGVAIEAMGRSAVMP